MNYKLDLYTDNFGIVRSKFKTDFIVGEDTLAVIVRNPAIDFYVLDVPEIHLKGQVVESKLLQVLFK